MAQSAPSLSMEGVELLKRRRTGEGTVRHPPLNEYRQKEVEVVSVSLAKVAHVGMMQ